MSPDAAPFGWPPPPRANADLSGHEDAEQTFLEAWAGGRLPHAWLITGPRGIGKATLAFRCARFLLTRPADTRPSLFGDAPPPDSLAVDPAHPAFHRIAAGGHLDLVTIERRFDDKRGKRRSEIVVGDVRAIHALTGYTAAEGGWRVVVVDAADEMNRNAANAILKVLEEPPPRTVLLLVAHNPGNVLPTIRSRCRRLALRPLDDAVVADLLRRYLPEVSAEDAAAAAPLAGGSIGRALTLAGQGGVALQRHLVDLLTPLPALDTVALYRFAEGLGRADADEAFAMACDLYRGLLAAVVRAAATGEAADGGLAARLAPAASLDRWLEVWDKTGALLGRVDRASLDRKQVILTLITSLQATVRG